MGKFSKIIRRLTSEQAGITGLETAIVLIAFVVVASVFAFTVLTTGLFTSKEAERASKAALATTENALRQSGSIIAGGSLAGGQAIDWSQCPTYPAPPAGSGTRYDDGSPACLAHAQLVRFSLTPGGKDPVAFDPESVNLRWYDTGSGRAGDGPVIHFPALNPIQTVPGFPGSVGPGENGAQSCINGTGMWCYRFEVGETDRVLQLGEIVEIFIGDTGAPIHQLEKNTLFTIEVILKEGPVVRINGKMPPVITQVMNITSVG